ncbi:hypothetical protein [Haloarcula nitratireducens]|uniref:SHOCT domain-containing protein n=1 Tax=Haloarcula nitratireducens TaxID=2487749 RepID=A0AAW4P6N1_9EURY|nr:hypothetical protein [Halomicroarcula nitratireducens]MBX0293534.1 hypothetical protein [Halomicroarcula nitratireducens]
MSWVSDNRHWLLFAGVVLTTLGAAGVAVVGLVATVSTLVAGGPLLGIVAATVLGTLLLAGLDVVFVAALASELASRASFPTNQGAADAFHRAERFVPPLRSLGLGDRFEPSLDERKAALDERYVEGDLSEREYEAELQTLLAEHDESIPNVSRETALEAADAHETHEIHETREVERET